MAAMAGNISPMRNNLKRMHADTASPYNAKREKPMTTPRDELSSIRTSVTEKLAEGRGHSQQAVKATLAKTTSNSQ